jgi:hypothetical protein
MGYRAKDGSCKLEDERRKMEGKCLGMMNGLG